MDPNNPYSASSNPHANYRPPLSNLEQIQEGDETGGLIPYKNPKALIAYYAGILSGLPLIGFPLGVIAFVFGILGLRDRRRNPRIRGSIHAGIGIGCGGFFALFWGTVLIILVTTLISNMPKR